MDIFKQKKDEKDLEILSGKREEMKEAGNRFGAEGHPEHAKRRGRTARLLAAFKKTIRAVQTEEKLYSKGKTGFTFHKAAHAGERRVAEDRFNHEREVRGTKDIHTDVYDYRFGTNYAAMMKQNRDAFRNCALQVLDEPAYQFVYRHWNDKDVLALAGFTSGSEAERENDMQMIRRYLNEEDREELLSELSEEVMSFHFSLAMTNRKWLSDNALSFCRMVEKAKGLGVMYRKNPELLKKLPETVRELLMAKVAMAEALDTEVFQTLVARGGEFSEEKTEYYTCRIFGEEEKKKKAERDKAVKRSRAAFKKAKYKELEISAKLSTFSETEEAAIARLTFEDFAGMLGAKNRGQIEFSKGKLKRVNDGSLSFGKGSETEQNYVVKERFYSAVMEHLSPENARRYSPYLKSVLGLTAREGTVSKPLSRKLLKEIVTEVNAMNSRMGRALYFGETRADHPEVKIAKRVELLIPGKISSKQEKDALKRRIRRILSEGKSSENARALSLSNHQMENIISNNLELLRDNIFRTLRAFDNNLLNLSGEKPVSPETWLSDEAFLKKVAALEIRKLAENTGGLPTTAELFLDHLLTEKSFSLAGKAGEEKKFEDIFVGGLSNGGAAGLVETLETHRDRLKNPEAFDTPHFQEKVSELARIFEDVKELTDAVRLWFNRDTKDRVFDAEYLQDKARRLDYAFGSDIPYREILSVLEGTRFYEGFMEAMNRVASGRTFAKGLSQILPIMEGNRVDREALPAPAYEEERRMKLSEEDRAALSKFTPEERRLADILMLNASPASLIKNNGDETAEDIMELRALLREYRPGEAMITSVRLAGTVLRLEQRKDGVMLLGSGTKRVMLPFSAGRLADHIEIDMATNMAKYGEAEVGKRLFSQKNDESVLTQVRERHLYLRGLMTISGKPATAFQDMDTKTMRILVNQLTASKSESQTQLTKSQIDKGLKTIGKENYFNEPETMILLKKLQEEKEQDQRKGRRNVEIVPVKKKEENDQEESWTEQEELVKDFIADVVFGIDTVFYDIERQLIGEGWEDIKNRGDRLLLSMQKNMKALFLIMEDDGILKRTIDKMALPEISSGGKNGGEKKSLKQSIEDDMNLILSDPDLTALKEEKKKGAADSQIQAKFRSMMELKKQDGALEKMEKKIDLDVAEVIEAMQKEIGDAAEQMFQTGGQKQEGKKNFEDPFAPNITYEEQQRRLKERSKELDRRIEEESRGSTGQGQYTKTVLKTYFAKSAPQDQRAMVASILRNSKPKKELKNASAEEIKRENDRVKGICLGGFLKGAGPLLHKMLQGLPEQGMPEFMKQALADVKSNLTPIPDEMIRLRLDSIVHSSHGEIEKITMERSLGAASVGQALLCRLYGPNLPAEGREVVVKLLRPEAKKRMERDKKILLAAAKECDKDGGMEATCAAQFDKIEEEFDLTIEEANAKKGLVYDGNGVNTVAMESLVYATKDTLVLAKAPGETVDHYLKDSERQRKAAMEDGSTTFARRNLTAKLYQMEKRQTYLAEVAEKWVREGIFDKGFYHGDLHAGNIMIDDDGATIIDFGNAVTLTAKQQKELTRLTAAAAVQNVDDFEDAFHQLLEKTPEKYAELQGKLKDEIREIFAVGTKESAGQMISLFLLRAQALGVEVPATINSFSQSQIRLQNTLDAINEEIKKTREALVELDGRKESTAKFDLAELCRKEETDAGEEAVGVTDGWLSKLHADGLSIYREIRLLGPMAREAFSKKRLSIFTEDTPKVQALKERLKELYTAQEQKKSREDLGPLEDAVVQAYEAAFMEYRRNTDVAKDVRDKLKNEELAADIEKELAPYFADTENGGQLLKDAYDAYRETQKANASGAEMKKAENLFLDHYLTMAGNYIYEAKRRKMRDVPRMRTFYKVMSQVLSANLSKSLDRLGCRKALSYRKELERKKILKVPGQKKDVTADPVEAADTLRLREAQKSALNAMPEELPEALLKVQAKRNWTEEYANRLSALEKDILSERRKNEVEEKNEVVLKEKKEEVQRIVATESPREVWEEIRSNYVKNRYWPEPEKKENNPGKLQSWTDFFDMLQAGMYRDLLMLEEITDEMEHGRVEKEFHRRMVEIPRKNGGEAFFEKVMQRQLSEGGEFAGEDLLSDFDGKYHFHTLENLSMLSFGIDGFDKNVRNYIARLLVLFGEKVEKGFKIRDAEYRKEVDKKKAAAHVLTSARENKYRSGMDFIQWIKDDPEAPSVPEEFEDDKELILTKLAEQGWTEPKEQELFDLCFTMLPYSPYDKDCVNFRIFLVELLKEEADTPEVKESWLTRFRSLLDALARDGRSFGNRHHDGLKGYQADALQFRIDRIRENLGTKEEDVVTGPPNKYRSIRLAWGRQRIAIKKPSELEAENRAREWNMSNMKTYCRNSFGRAEDLMGYYQAQTVSPQKLIQEHNYGDKEAMKNAFSVYGFSEEFLTEFMNVFYDEKEESSEMEELMLFLLVDMRSRIEEKPEDFNNPEKLANIKSTCLHYAEDLLYLDAGGNNHMKKFREQTCMEGCGKVPEETRRKLLSLIEKEQKR